MEKGQLLEIDVDAVIRAKAPRHYKYIPKWLIRKLERTICQDRLNALLRELYPRRGADFCRGVLKSLNVDVRYHNLELLPDIDNTRVLFVSNHPLGGLDGMALIDFVQRHYNTEPGFIVNDLLQAVEPLSDVFLPINKHGAQSRQAVSAIDEAFAGDKPLIMFPAGLVSRRGKGGVIKDLEWQKMFITKARQSKRIIIPLHFCGENSTFFYKFAKFRQSLGLKFNIEMIYLPREVFRSEGKTFDVVIGNPIEPEQLTGNSATAIAQKIKELVYSLEVPSR